MTFEREPDQATFVLCELALVIHLSDVAYV
jgi:hypothetical protein